MSAVRIVGVLILLAIALVFTIYPSETEGASQDEVTTEWGTISCGGNWSYDTFDSPYKHYKYTYSYSVYNTADDANVLTIESGGTLYYLNAMFYEVQVIILDDTFGAYLVKGFLEVSNDFVMIDINCPYGPTYSHIEAKSFIILQRTESSSSQLIIYSGEFKAYGQLNLVTNTYNDGKLAGTKFYSGDSTSYVHGTVVNVGNNRYLSIIDGKTYTDTDSLVYCQGSSLITDMVIHGKYLNDSGTDSGAIITWTETLVSADSFFMFSEDLFDDTADSIVFKNTSGSQLNTSYNCIVFSEGKSVDARYSNVNDRWIHIFSSGPLEGADEIDETTLVVDDDTVSMFVLFESEQFNEFLSYQSDCIDEIDEYEGSYPQESAIFKEYVIGVAYDLYDPSESMAAIDEIMEEFRYVVDPPKDYVEVPAGKSVTIKDITISAIDKKAVVDPGKASAPTFHVFVKYDGSVKIDNKLYSNPNPEELDLEVNEDGDVFLVNGTVTAYASITINEVEFRPVSSGATLDIDPNLLSGAIIMPGGVGITVEGNCLTTVSESEIAYGETPLLVSGEVNLELESSVISGTVKFKFESGSYISISSDNSATFGTLTKMMLSRDSENISCENTSGKEVEWKDTEHLFDLLVGYEGYKALCVERAQSYHTPSESDETKRLINRYSIQIENRIYSVSVSDEENKNIIQRMLQELIISLDVDYELYFNDERDTLIIMIESLHSPGESAEVRAYLDDIVVSLSSLIYDQGLSLDDNLARLSEYDYETIVEYVYQLNLAEFRLYVANIDALINAERENCSCYNEVQLIEDYHKMVSTLEYNREQGIKYNTDQVDLLYEAFREKLGEIRPSAESFEIHLNNAIAHVEGCDDMGLKDVKTLISDHSGKLKTLTFDKSASLDNNISRVDSIVESFDSKYNSVAANTVNSHRDDVLKSMKTELDNAKNDDMREIINRYIDNLSAFRYDSSISYTDNIAYIDGLDSLMRKELSHIEDNLSSRFDYYRAAYAASFRERIEVTENPDAVAILESAISDVYTMEYDNNLTLDQNRLRLDNLACDVQKKLKELESEVVEAQFEEYRQKALNYISSKVVDGGNSSTDECIESYKAEILAVQYDPGKTPEENQKIIQDIIERYDNDINAIASQSLFDSAKSQCATYLENKFGSYREVRSVLDGCCDSIKAVKYDDSISEEDNINVLQKMTADYIAVIDEALKQAELDESAAYRKEAARIIESYRDINDSDAVKSIIDRYSTKIQEYQIEGRSYLFNQTKIDSIVSEFIDEHTKQINAENAEYFSKYMSGIEKKILSKHAEGESERAEATIDAALEKAKSLSFNPLLTVQENTAIADEIVSNLEEDLSILKIDNETEFKNGISAFVKNGEAAISEFDAELRIYLSSILADVEKLSTSTEKLSERINAFISLKNKFNEGLKIQSSIDEYDSLRKSYTAEAEYEHMVNESSAVKILINDYIRSIENVDYSIEESKDKNFNRISDLRTDFLNNLERQRLTENALVVGDLKQDRTSTGGGTPEYPKGCEDIWGTISNEQGMPDVSITMSRSNDKFSCSYEDCVSTGRFYVLTGDGEIASSTNMDALCSFDIILKEGTKTFNSFSGMYEVSILLPEDLRSYQKFQVVCFDEYGHMQVLDCRIEGNFLIFYTTHFSEFSLFGINIAPGEFTMNELIVITLSFAGLLALVLLCLTHSVRYDPNGGEGRMPISMFVHRTHSRLERCRFVRNGYRFVGWTVKSGELYPDCSDIDSLGKFRHITLYAVWEAEE